MVRIKNTMVTGLNESVVKSSYPMSVGEPPDIINIDMNSKDIKRAINLGNVKSGAGDDCFLKGIKVDFDIRYSLYFTKQLQRYHFLDFVSSQSTMHSITKMDITDSCNQYVDPKVIAVVEDWLYWYKEFDNLCVEQSYSPLDPIAVDAMGMKKPKVVHINLQNAEGEIITATLTKYDILMRLISNIPSGFEYWAGMTTNYLQLKSIYHQRKNHKLKEDWGYFCKWIEELPMFEELVLSKGRNNVNKNV